MRRGFSGRSVVGIAPVIAGLPDAMNVRPSTGPHNGRETHALEGTAQCLRAEGDSGTSAASGRGRGYTTTVFAGTNPVFVRYGVSRGGFPPGYSSSFPGRSVRGSEVT